jgi:ligand-binding SRPBCC domain-containing protein
MPAFDFSFTVLAPLQAVAEFHHSTAALNILVPPPVITQLHEIQPLAEGSRSSFTMWFGPIPIHWVAIHSRVDPLHGFTDTQSSGPLRSWQHTHHFSAEGPELTRVSEHIEYQVRPGLAGLLSLLVFSRPALTFMFAYRRMVTRRILAHRAVPIKSH